MANRTYLWIKTAAPTVNDDGTAGYTVGDKWVDTANDIVYTITDSSTGAAVWVGGDDPVSSQSVLASDFTLSAASGTFEDTGLSVALPSAGTYIITANVRNRIVGNTGTFWAISAKLYNSTDAADVSNSVRRMLVTFSTTQIQLTSSISLPVTVTAAKTIKLYADRETDGSFTTSQIPSSSTTGLTSLMYFKIR